MKKSILLMLALSISLFHNTDSYAQTKPHRQKVGVVLSGGGAKAFAHIALLRKLEELKIPVDYIGGTSMGATIAALYALGYSPDELEKIIRETDWFSLFEETPERSERSLYQKYIFEGFPANIDVNAEGLVPPKGLISGRKIAMYLSRLTWGTPEFSNFTQYPTPFFCTATDMEKGDEVVFTSGNISESLRASMAIPSVFEPVEIDGKVYLDGGVASNLPVDRARQMGANIIIASDVGAPLYKKDELTSLPRIIEQSVSFLAMRNNEQKRSMTDVLVLPDVSSYTSMSFDKANEILAEGTRAVNLQQEKLLILSKKFAGFTPAKRIRTVGHKNAIITVDSIEFRGLRKKIENTAKILCGIKPGDKVGSADIEKSIRSMYGSENFSKIRYSIENRNGKSTLKFFFEERSDNKIHIGFSADKYMKGALHIAYETNGLVFNNSHAAIRARFAEYPKLTLAYAISTPIDPGLFIAINSEAYSMDFTLYENNRKKAVYEITQQTTEIGFGPFISNWMLAIFGMKKDFFFIDTNISDEAEKIKMRFDNLSAFAALRLDTLDSLNFPRKGFFVDGEYDYVDPKYSFRYGDYYKKRFWHATANCRFAIPISKKISLHSGAAMGASQKNNIPPTYLFAMGGNNRYERWVFPLEGYDTMQITGLHGWTYFSEIQYEFAKRWFITAKWNEGKACSALSQLKKYSNTKAGYGIKLSYNSAIGPVEAGLFRKKNDGGYNASLTVGFVY